MSTTMYRANTRDTKFVLWEQLGIEKLHTFPRYRDFDRDTLEMVIDQAARFAEQELAPANAEGDRVGCRYEQGHVYAPACFRGLLHKFREAGWVNLSSDPEVGGQGLPYAVTTAVNEFFMGANFSFCSYPMLAFGAGHLIESFGTPAQKDRFMRKMYSGQWGGTMCLTEPQAGSALADIKTVAKPAGDHYLLSGTKMFITSGDHDLMENIVHTVLARIEGAPPGVKGLSLFIVPKIRVNEDGSLGEPNDVSCGGIEHKIGLHGSATCVLTFGENGDCHGYLLGGEHQGLQCMFQLMNEARIEVGLQGVAQSSAAYLNALAYAKERIQGVDVRCLKDPHAPRVEIIKHPDVRRNLLTAKAHVEGMRALLLYTAYLIDLSHSVEDKEERERYHNRVELLTPICKAYCSDTAFRMIEVAVQIFGGYGVCSEYPVEQYLRDCKIASIYEGTNGIQALDLLGRKIGMKGGQVFMELMEEIGTFARSKEGRPGLDGACKELLLAKDKVVETMMHMGMLNMSGDLLYPVLNASPFLMMCGTVMIGYLLLWQASVAWEKLYGAHQRGAEPDKQQGFGLVEGTTEAAFYSGKIEAARFFAFNILPQVESTYKAIMAGDRSALTIAENAF